MAPAFLGLLLFALKESCQWLVTASFIPQVFNYQFSKDIFNLPISKLSRHSLPPAVASERKASIKLEQAQTYDTPADTPQEHPTADPKNIRPLKPCHRQSQGQAEVVRQNPLMTAWPYIANLCTVRPNREGMREGFRSGFSNT